MVKVQLDRVTKEFGLPVVFVTKVLHAHDKERYLAARQALVVPGRFAYLPFAGLKQDDRQTEFAVTRETFSPIAQLIVLGFLEHCFNLPLTIKGVAQMLQVSEPSVQQAMKEIEFFGLAERKRKNGTKSFEFEFRFCGRELWDRSQSLLSSPVKKTVGLLSLTSVGGDDCTVAGVDALAGISMLNEQDPSVFAFPLTGFGKRGLKLVSTVGAPIKAQLWAYDPKKLGKTSIDVLSLILSLRGETDDRVQIETDRILEEFKWQQDWRKDVNVHTRDISKHKNDIVRIVATIDIHDYNLPPYVKEQMSAFVKKYQQTEIDVKTLGISVAFDEILKMLRVCFGLV